MFEKLSDNLNHLMSVAGINASELARLTGIPASTIKKIRNRNNPNPTLMTLVPIAKQFNVTLSQLVGDRIEENKQGIESSCFCAGQKSAPIISWADALSWPKISSNVFQRVIVDDAYNEAVYALIVSESDWVGFAENSLIIIDPSAMPAHRQYALVCREGQSSPTIRQFLLDDGQMYFRSVVDGSHSIISASQYQVLGVVVEYRNRLIHN